MRPEADRCGIRMERVTVRWPAADACAPAGDTLTDVSLTVTTGQLVAVVGQVGCGKSSLLHHILGELPALVGSSSVTGRLAYAPQEPWLFSGSIRQNVLCGLPFDAVR